MKKSVKKILVLMFSFVLLVTSSIPVLAANSCPPHTTFPDVGGVIGTNTTSLEHRYVDEVKTYPDGTQQIIYGTCGAFRITYTYLVKYICSKCNIITGSGTTTSSEEIHPSCR